MDSVIAQVRGHVRGRVQGVGFRYFVRSVAHRHGLSGYALNLVDGRVEFLLQGETDHIEKVIEQIRSGPPHARVDEVSLATFQDKAARGTVIYDGFEIR